MSDTAVIFNILARDNASSTFGKVGRNIATIAGGMLTGNLVMGGLSKAWGFAKTAVIGFNSELQNSSIAFTTMLGSAQKSKTFLDQLQAFAKSTPFEFGDLVKNAQNMMGMGIAAKDVIPDLRALGDSVASIGGSAQQVNSVTLAFDQMTAKGTLDMGNMNQLMQNGVPSALKILAAGYKVTTGEMIKMISTGKVQASVAMPLLISGLEKGTTATAALGGMMDKQSQTFTGALSNISDGLTQAIAGAFKPFFDIASTGAQKLGTFFSSPTFSAFGARVSAGMSAAISTGKKFISGFDFTPVRKVLTSVWTVITKDLVPAVKNIVSTFGPLVATIGKDLFGAVGQLGTVLAPAGAMIKDIFGFVGAHKTTFQALAVGIGAIVAWQTLWNIQLAITNGIVKVAAALQLAWNAAMALNPIGLIVIAIVGLVAAFVYLWTHSAAFRNFFIGLWHDIWGFLKTVGAWFAGPFADFFVGAWHAIADAGLWLWHNVLDPIWQGISAGVGFVMNIVKSLINLWLFVGNGIFQPIWKNVIKPVFDGMGVAAMWLWHTVIAPTVTGIGVALKVAGGYFTWLWRDIVSPAFNGVAAAARWVWHDILQPVFGAVMATVHAVGRVFQSVFGAIGGFIAGAFHDAVGIVKGVINTIVDMVNGAVGFINSNFIAVADKVPGVSFPYLGKLPHLATGGDITRSGMVMVGERGPEPVFLPAGSRVLPHGTQFGGGQQAVILSAAPGDQVAELLLSMLRPHIQSRYNSDVTAALAGTGR